MAKKLDSFTFARRTRSKKYPDEWLDGEKYQISEGEDYDKGKQASCISVLRNRARSQGKTTHVQILSEKAFVLQAVVKDGKPEQQAPQTKPKRTRKQK